MKVITLEDLCLILPEDAAIVVCDSVMDDVLYDCGRDEDYVINPYLKCKVYRCEYDRYTYNAYVIYVDVED